MKETAMLGEGRSFQSQLEAARRRHRWKEITYDPEIRAIFSPHPDDIESRILYLKRKRAWIAKAFAKGGRRK